jgi:hypothetical protein
MDFVVQNEVKNAYLLTKPTGTAKSIASVLKVVDEYEKINNKFVYDLSINEIDELFTMFKNSSFKSATKSLSIIRGYIDYCHSIGLVFHGENRFNSISSERLRNFVSLQALRNSYFSLTQLREYQKRLFNIQDQLLIELPYFGVRGRPQKGATLEEIINLRYSPDHTNKKNNLIEVMKNDGESRYVKVPDSTIELIEDVFTEEYYIGNNGVDDPSLNHRQTRKIKVNHIENYVFRIPGEGKSNKFNPTLLNSRISKIQKWVGNQYLTFNTLYQSGMVNMASEILKEKGELTKEDYLDICIRFEYGKKPEDYWFNVKALVEQYKEFL